MIQLIERRKVKKVATLTKSVYIYLKYHRGKKTTARMYIVYVIRVVFIRPDKAARFQIFVATIKKKPNGIYARQSHKVK